MNKVTYGAQPSTDYKDNHVKSGINSSPGLPIIEMRDVVKVFNSPAGKFIALNRVNLSINPGEFVSIVGKSGSGKTTLINMLTGIDSPSEGEIYIGGTAIHKLSDGDVAIWRGQTIGVVFQFFQLLPTLTVMENVMLPMDLGNYFSNQERVERTKFLLDLVGLTDQSDKFPMDLSGGQQQAAAIARALANDPPIIATDEPTGNLDSKAAKAVLHLFEDLVKQGKTILMVTHDDELAKQANRIITIKDGKIINTSSGSSLLNYQR